MQGSAQGLASVLRSLQTAAPKAVEEGMREGALLLQGALVQREIAATDPKPVDRGQYKAGWVTQPVEGGAVVGNLSKHALFIERGRAPGPVPFRPILEWVRRKGFVRASVKAAKKALGIRRDSKGRYQAATKTEIEQAEVTAALAIQRKIEQQGIQPRWVLKRALAALRPKMRGILSRALGGVKV